MLLLEGFFGRLSYCEHLVVGFFWAANENKHQKQNKNIFDSNVKMFDERKETSFWTKLTK